LADQPVAGAEQVIDDFVELLAERAATAAASVEVTEQHLELAGQHVLVRVAGRGLAELFGPALRHAQVGPGEPDLVIEAWDRAATGVLPPAPVWSSDDLLPTGAVRGRGNDRYRITYDAWMRMLTVFDRVRSRVYVHVADVAEVPDWVRRSPLRNPLSWWAADNGVAVLHAGTVDTGEGAVAIAGASGSGKSTTTLACVSAGMGFMGDDACMVRFGPEPVASPMFGLGKLELDDGCQEVLDLTERMSASAPLRAVLLVSVAAQRQTTAEPMSSAQAFKSLVAGSLDEGAGSALAGLRRVATEVPCYRVQLGSDRAAVVDAVRAAAR
jgi:hypothetical protein